MALSSLPFSTQRRGVLARTTRRTELLPHNFLHAILPISLQTSPINFGLVVLQDVFQKQLDTGFEGRNGVTGITDDTFVYGSSDVVHDRNLTKLMETAKRRPRYSTKTKCGSRLRKSSFFLTHQDATRNQT